MKINRGKVIEVSILIMANILAIMLCILPLYLTRSSTKAPKVSETNSAADRVIIMDYPRVDKNIFTIELTSYDGSLGSTVHVSRDELKRIKTRIDEVLK